jgi:23S rRNA (pseudouridine1915-N3)-methyltransferase
MRLRVIAVGTRMPEWVDAAVEDYSRRLRGSWKFEIKAVASASRRESGGAAPAAIRCEARRILALIGAAEIVVPLDEQGEQFTTLELSGWLEGRRHDGQDLTFIIGGPDGLGEEVLARGRWRWSLSRLTLPHALARVVLAEQIYRASTVLSGHPYHRG